MDEASPCPACGRDDVLWVPDAYAYVCSACAAVIAEAPLVQEDAAPHQPNALAAVARRWPHAYDKSAAREEHDARRQADIAAQLRSAAARLGYADAAATALGLWTRARTAALGTDGVAPAWRGGRAAAALATAVLYAVLRDGGRIVDLAAVAVAMDQALPAAARACSALRPLAWMPRAHVQDPALYLPGQLAYLAALPRDELDRAAGVGRAAWDWTAVERLSGELAQLCTRFEWPNAMQVPPVSFALLIHAMEGTLRRPVRVTTLAECAPAAMARRGPGWLVGATDGSAATVLARYADVARWLRALVEALPWVAQRPIQKRQRDRARRAGTAPTSGHATRLDVAMHMQDAVVLARRSPAPARVLWADAVGAPRPAPSRAPRKAPGVASVAARLGLHGRRIDELSEAEVDARLFGPDEWASYLRTDEEQSVYLHLKGWADEAPAMRAPNDTGAPLIPPTAPKRRRIAMERAYLAEPLDVAQQQDYAAEWDGDERP